MTTNKNKSKRNNNFRVVEKWLLENKCIQKRKYYLAKELFSIFVSDTSIDNVTQRGFNRHLNTCTEKYVRIQKVERGYRSYAFIILNDVTMINKQLRISPRRKQHTISKSPSHSHISPLASVSAPSANHSNNCEKSTLLSSEILKMKKIDLPVALSFFLGKERAQKIQKEKESESDALNIKTPVFYGDLVSNHIETQIDKLQLVHLTHTAWKSSVQDYEPCNKFTDYEIFSIRMKAFYLQRFYQLSLEYYNTISDINDIARLALFQANRDLGLYRNKADIKHLNVITNAKTLLLWFRTYRIRDEFPNEAKARSRKVNKPLFLTENPDAVKKIISYCKSNLDTLSVELLHNYIHNKLFPETVTVIQKERDDCQYNLEKITVIKEGWCGKPKGSLQVLYERGWIDKSKLSLYTLNGSKVESIAVGDVTGCSYSISALMKLQTDFVNEITLLQFHTQKLGASIDRSPKCHPELAGEGIEYAWALAKLRYRRAPMSEKRNKSKFFSLVRVSTNPMDTLHIRRIRSCSKRARSYMKLYKSISEIEKDGITVLDKKHIILESTIKLYLRLKKVSKTHRSVVDMQLREVMDIEDSSVNVNSINSSEDELEMKGKTITLLVKKMNCM